MPAGDGSATAHDPAQYLCDFINTREPQTSEELFLTAHAARRWFADRGVLRASSRLHDGDLLTLTTAREALRHLLLGRDRTQETTRGTTARGELNAVLAAVPLRLRVTTDGCRLEPVASAPAERCLASIAEAVRGSSQDDTWPRIKICRRDSCHWAFVDQSRNRSRQWCSMAGCGNAIKNSRRRHAARGQAAP